MKKQLIYILLISVLVGSCTKSFLDQKNPNSVTSANFWQTEGDLKAAMGAVYNPMAVNIWGGYGSLGWLRREYQTEVFGVREWSWVEQTYSFSETPGNQMFINYFPQHYNGINFCNQILEHVPNMPVDETVKAKYTAEAKFMRGLYYWFLVEDWGSVPLRLTVAQSKADYPIARSPEADVWKQVEKDFTEASQGLPDKRPASEVGRPTKGAALAYLGRALLHQGKWAQAQTTLKSIVDNASTYGYGLQPNYSELFDGQHKNGVEGVFEIQHNKSGGTDVWGSGNAQPQTTARANVDAPGGTIGGWDYLVPTKALLDSFLAEPAADGSFDPRALATIAWDYPGCKLYQKDYHATWGSLTEYGQPKICNRKFGNWWSNTSEDAYSSLNEYGMRYADVLLMLAEAYTMQGNVTSAAPLVHQIRQRAKLTDIQAQMLTWSQDQMMGEIKRQRLLEFAEEGLYYYDLRRWGMLATKIQNSYNPYKAQYSAKHNYYPIPQSELDNNKLMVQADAWK